MKRRKYEKKNRRIFYEGKIKVVSLPNREFSPESEYPELIGLTGNIMSIHGSKVGISIDGRYNKNSLFGWYWFEARNLERV